MSTKRPTQPRFDVTSLGETMLRLSLPAGQRLETMRHLDVHPGGTESNVCFALAGLGRRCAWLSRLPDNALGRLVLRQMRSAGVDISSVVLSSADRMGTYYVEFGTPIRVIYDRANSAIARMQAADVSWETLLDTRILHLTGITPALSQNCRDIVGEAIERAQAAGVFISFDVNYRRLLWLPDEAAAALRPLIARTNMLICAEADARELFNGHGEPRDVLMALRAQTDAEVVVVTRGNEGALALHGDHLLEQPARPATIIDRLGAGDAFAAGLLDGWLDDSLTAGLQRGTALAAMALSQEGDMLVVTRKEMEAILSEDNRGVLR